MLVIVQIDLEGVVVVFLAQQLSSFSCKSYSAPFIGSAGEYHRCLECSVRYSKTQVIQQLRLQGTLFQLYAQFIATTLPNYHVQISKYIF